MDKLKLLYSALMNLVGIFTGIYNQLKDSGVSFVAVFKDRNPKEMLNAFLSITGILQTSWDGLAGAISDILAILNASKEK